MAARSSAPCGKIRKKQSSIGGKVILSLIYAAIEPCTASQVAEKQVIDEATNQAT